MQSSHRNKANRFDKSRAFLSALMLSTISLPTLAQDGGAADLAKQLSNPISSLISLPFQLISRTILPLIVSSLVR